MTWLWAAGILAVTLCALSGAAAWLARLHVRRIERDHPPGGAFVEIDGVRLHYRRTGRATEPAVLVLHGASSNLEETRLALAERFAGEHVIWLDRPGLGWSERPAGEWTPQREAQLIAAFLDALQIECAAVIGHSWGGAIAMRLAIDHPQRVTGLVLIAPALSAWIGDAAWFNAASFWPVIGPLLQRVAVPLAGRAQAAAGAVSAFHPEPMPPDYVARSGLLLLLRPSNWRANAADMKDVNRHLDAQQTLYAAVQHPTVMLAAKPDTVLWSQRHAGEVAPLMPRAQLRWIERAGHNLHHHHPDAVLEALHRARAQAGELSKPVQIAGGGA